MNRMMLPLALLALRLIDAEPAPRDRWPKAAFVTASYTLAAVTVWHGWQWVNGTAGLLILAVLGGLLTLHPIQIESESELDY